MLFAFEGNRAETKTMLPVIEKFMAAHRLPDVTVVADAGMISDANMNDIEAAGLSFILGMKVPDVPYLVDKWRREHPGEEIPDGHVFTQRWPAGPASRRRDQLIYYQYRAARARRTLHGIDEQVAKAAKAGPSGNSSRRPAATAPSRSRPASTSSPPPTHSPTTYAKPSTPSTTPAGLRTNLSQLRS
jgi:hypothetical protein